MEKPAGPHGALTVRDVLDRVERWRTTYARRPVSGPKL
jgi:hypothetical protein